MTLSERNAFFKIAIVFCSIFTVLVLIASFYTIPLYYGNDLSLDEEASARPSSVFQVFTSIFISNNYYAVHAAIIAAVLFSLAGMIFIHNFFERTSAPETLYIAIFILSFVFEGLRLILPLHIILDFPSVYVRFAMRILLFTRFFGFLSLFAASIYSAGLEIQKNRNFIFIIIIATLLITLRIPIDVLNWDTSLNMITGFISMFRLIELAVFITTLISFLLAARIRGSADYNHIAIGAVIAMTGRNIILNTDNWIGFALGIASVMFGVWYLCAKLHKIHLWL